MEQTYELLKDDLQDLIAEFNEEKNDHRILASMVKKIATLDDHKFIADYDHLSSILNNERGDLKLAIRAVQGIQILSVLTGKFPRSLCSTLAQVHDLIYLAIFPGH